ncbi:permease-like cell division protein FtsX [Corynebacterium pyruviciproducens]|uniref:permease-like cell division protein FtsX n=1 Tax=Corynebacterium pyruviciproducens TaxID=598660 RepID=UPI00254F0A08|nr:permease-like cell division protein FtsX [Corynebacterium pyruviciproducens]MDK6565524.1 permease-like cell division protein FtsX [Corynebacterium pyruviciproducens]
MGYVFKEGFKGLGRNVTMTLALVITTAISLALLATGFLVTNMTSATKDIYLDRVEVMVQLDENISAGDKDCSTPECREVLTTLEKQDGVESVTFRSRAQSYERFKELFQDTDPILVRETSPDALPAAVHVRLTDPLNTTPLDAVRNMKQVSDVLDQAQDLEAATKNLDAVRNATFVVAAVQALAALFLIGNMVQIAAFHRREEVSIMRMVGASRWYTQAPFVLEAVLSTFIGALVAAAGLFLGKQLVVDPALQPLYDSRLVAPITSGDLWTVWPIVTLLGLIASGVTAYVALRLYVRR